MMGEARFLRYNRGARALHWAIAVLVIANLATGLLHNPLEGYIRLIPFHKSTGLTIFALSVLRLVWRATWQRPPYPSDVSRSAILSARIVQALFYVLMLVMPLTGWIIASAGKYPLTWFDLFPLPKLGVSRESATYVIGHEAHELLGWLFLLLVVLHVGAALRHHILLRDQILRRML